MKKLLLSTILCLVFQLSKSQTDYALLLAKPTSGSQTERSLVEWNLNTNSFTEVVKGIPFSPTQILIDSTFIYIVGENSFLFKYALGTYAKLDSINIDQNSRLYIDNDYLLLSSSSQVITRIDKYNFNNRQNFSGTVNGTGPITIALMNGNAYLSRWNLGVQPLAITEIDLGSLQITYADSTSLGTGSEQRLIPYQDSLLQIVVLNKNTFNFEVRRYNTNLNQVSSVDTFLSNRTFVGFQGTITSADDGVFAIDRFVSDHIQKFSFTSKTANVTFVDRSNFSTFDRLKFDENSNSIFINERNDTTYRYNASTGAFIQKLYHNGFTFVSDMAFFNSSLTSIEKKNSQQFNIYPNPFSSGINLNLSHYSSVQIRDLQGRLVEQFQLPRGKHFLPLKNLNNSIYSVIVQDDKSSFQQRIVNMK